MLVVNFVFHSKATKYELHIVKCNLCFMHIGKGRVCGRLVFVLIQCSGGFVMVSFVAIVILTAF
jgi:hypothetical protein